MKNEVIDLDVMYEAIPHVICGESRKHESNCVPFYIVRPTTVKCKHGKVHLTACGYWEYFPNAKEGISWLRRIR